MLGSTDAAITTRNDCKHEAAVRLRSPTPQGKGFQTVTHGDRATLNTAQAKFHGLQRPEDEVSVSMDHSETGRTTKISDSEHPNAKGAMSFSEAPSGTTNQTGEPAKTACDFISRMARHAIGRRVAHAVALCSEAVANNGGHSHDCLATEEGRKTAETLIRELRLTGLHEGPTVPAQGFLDTGTRLIVCQERIARRVYPAFEPSDHGEAFTVLDNIEVKSIGKIIVHLEILNQQHPNQFRDLEVYVVRSIPGNIDMLIGRKLIMDAGLLKPSGQDAMNPPEEDTAQSGAQ